MFHLVQINPLTNSIGAFIIPKFFIDDLVLYNISLGHVNVTGSQLGLLGHLGQGTVAPRYCSTASPLGFVG
jgi:hypothetical protein